MRRKTAGFSVYIFCHTDFMNQQFYYAKLYFHFSKKGPEDTFFVVAVTVATGGGAGPGPAVNQERVNGI